MLLSFIPKFCALWESQATPVYLKTSLKWKRWPTLTVQSVGRTWRPCRLQTSSCRPCRGAAGFPSLLPPRIGWALRPALRPTCSASWNLSFHTLSLSVLWCSRFCYLFVSTKKLSFKYLLWPEPSLFLLRVCFLGSLKNLLNWDPLVYQPDEHLSFQAGMLVIGGIPGALGFPMLQVCASVPVKSNLTLHRHHWRLNICFLNKMKPTPALVYQV